MIRLLIAATFLAVAAVPALACPWTDSAATDSKPSTVAAQPAGDQGTPPPAPTTTGQKPS